MYIIQSVKNGGYYIGSCGNIEKRLCDHNSNQTRSTKHKGPFELVCKESFDTKTAAIKREKQVKRYKGGRFFKKLVNNVPVV
jgi:putative endonuclease